MIIKEPVCIKVYFFKFHTFFYESLYKIFPKDNNNLAFLPQFKIQNK